MQKMKYLSCHVESDGLNFNTNKNVSDGFSAVSVGMVVCDSNLSPIDEIIVYNNDSNANQTKEYHGIDNKFLRKYGISEIEAAIEIKDFLNNNFDLNYPITPIGHNISSFSLPFIKKLLYENDFLVPFSSNMIDTYSILFGVFGDYTLNDMLEAFDVPDLSKYKEIPQLSALYKCHIFLNICKTVREMANE